MYEGRARELLEKDGEFVEYRKFVEEGPPAGCREVPGYIWEHKPQFIVASALSKSEKSSPNEIFYLIFFEQDPKTRLCPSPQWVPQYIIEAAFPLLIVNWLKKIVEQ